MTCRHVVKSTYRFPTNFLSVHLNWSWRQMREDCFGVGRCSDLQHGIRAQPDLWIKVRDKSGLMAFDVDLGEIRPSQVWSGIFNVD